LFNTGGKFHPGQQVDDFPHFTNKEIKAEIIDVVKVLKGFENLGEEYCEEWLQSNM
jgi:hypothetical protein